MHIHLPKPLHGWREFLGEVGIIVVGVLIALGAEQVVEALHWRTEVRDFRGAVDNELGLNLSAYQYSMRQRPCVAHRLAELESVLSNSSKGRKLSMKRAIGRPQSVSFYYSVWDSKEPSVAAHLEDQVRQRYAALYDEYHNADLVRLGERDAWRSLAQFDQPEPLDHSDRMRLRELLTKATQLDTSTRGNWRVIKRLSDSLDIKPIDQPDFPLSKYDPLFCDPLFR